MWIIAHIRATYEERGELDHAMAPTRSFTNVNRVSLLRTNLFRRKDLINVAS